MRGNEKERLVANKKDRSGQEMKKMTGTVQGMLMPHYCGCSRTLPVDVVQMRRSSDCDSEMNEVSNCKRKDERRDREKKGEK